MKIQNKYVDIKIGNKSFRKHNFFLDSYLEIFSKSQYQINFSQRGLMSGVYLKLDTPLNNVKYDTQLSDAYFDVYIYSNKLQTIKNSNNLSAIYTYSNDVSYYLNENNTWVEYQDRSLLNGRKITAISFCLQTFLDTRNYNLMIENSEIINISREDLIVTDAIYRGNDEFPYHLDVENKYTIYESGGAPYSAEIKTRLYSVGLGYNIGQMDEEYIIGDDVENVEVTVEDDFTYSFLITKAVDSGVYPSNNAYPSTSLQPKTFKIKTSLYANSNLYSGNNLYPRAGDYKYIIMKYKNYYINRGSQIIDLDETYTMSFYTSKEGLLTVKDRIERGEQEKKYHDILYNNENIQYQEEDIQYFV